MHEKGRQRSTIFTGHFSTTPPFALLLHLSPVWSSTAVDSPLRYAPVPSFGYTWHILSTCYIMQVMDSGTAVGVDVLPNRIGKSLREYQLTQSQSGQHYTHMPILTRWNHDIVGRPCKGSNRLRSPSAWKGLDRHEPRSAWFARSI